ncbi:MAG: glycine cleavage system protein GcvH [Acidobacteriota bacterium]
MYPSEYLYSPEHEWLKVEGDEAKLGITAYAQEELGEVVFVELPAVGSQMKAGDEIGTIESVKAVAELYTPVSGEVIAVNDAVVDDPEVLNDDPHAKGWLVKVRLASKGELDSLMNAEKYDAFLQDGEH